MAKTPAHGDEKFTRVNGARTPGAPEARIRRRYEIRGRVQGVGFRPYVYRLASEAGLGGHVGNSPQGAFAELEGSREQIESFGRRLMAEQPPLVEIGERSETELSPQGERDFRILPSSQGGEQRAEIAPDTATCPDCLRELMDPEDRRHRYPFINCTNCGPRYSIIRAVPYDRASTTMAAFTQCPDCQAEYDSPVDRRFHAQPNACSLCGPRVWLVDTRGEGIAGDPIVQTARLLQGDGIVAIKGLGGFHLACRADSDAAVKELRRRKARETKPLALMVASLAAAEALVHLDEFAAGLLRGPAHPIVLAPRRLDGRVSEAVAPGTDCLGVMLPYTPLHELLFAAGLGPLVMTSGNPSAEPLCCDNAEALARLGALADAFLLHDRDIERRVDDSVVQSVHLVEADGARRSRMQPLRRSRGYAPAPLRLTRAAQSPILAVGGELKSAVCLLGGDEAVLSEHLGDLDNPAAYRNFVGTIARFQELLDLEPALVACDLHPGYAATRYAHQLGLPVTEVQHHHAHMASCMADNGLGGEVLGLSCDGTGYGTDGSVWGCELLAGDEAEFRRLGHLRPFPLLGGDAAAIETWRPALALLIESFGEAWPDAAPAAARRMDPAAAALMKSRLAAPAARPLMMMTSSLGRLFDGVAWLLGVCEKNRCEAQAPMALEAVASLGEGAAPLDGQLETDAAGRIALDFRPLIRALCAGIAGGRSRADLALAFHETLALLLSQATQVAAEQSGLGRVCLSGGSFANRLLLGRLWTLLREKDLDVYIHQRVPPGDGGLALGQALVAAARSERGEP